MYSVPSRVADRSSGARREILERHLETLALLGELQRTDDGRYGVSAAAS